jgi:hypothetical protein
MARGFESKSVADQQEAAQNQRPGNDRRLDPRRRSLELARADVSHRLEGATSGPHREMLERALADLDARLREMRAPETPPQE